MATTDRSGSLAEYSSAQGHGTTAAGTDTAGATATDTDTVTLDTAMTGTADMAMTDITGMAGTADTQAAHRMVEAGPRMPETDIAEA